MADLASALLGDLKRKTFAQQLAEQAASTSPARGGWGEALARALQGGMAGYLEKQDNEAEGAKFDQAYGPATGGQTTPATPSLAQRLGAMLGGGQQDTPRPPAPIPNTTSPRVYDANELSPIDAQIASPKQRMAAYGPTIDAAANQQGLDPKMLARQLVQESGLNPMAVSPKGAAGIGQLMPGTAKDLGVTDSTDPQQSINGSAAYMRQNLDRFGGNQNAALAAYNWGPANTQRWQAQGGDPSKLPAETQGYIRNITNGQQTADNAALPPNAAPTQGTLPQGPQSTNPQMNVSRVAPQIPPDVFQRARALAVAGNQAQAAALIQPYLTPKDQELPVTDPAERARYGLSPDDKNAYQRNSATNKITAVNPQPFAVNLKNQNESAFEKDYGAGQAKRAIETLDAGDKAAANLQNVQLMRGLMSNIQTGKLTPIGATMGSWLQAAGIDPKAVGIDPALPANAEAIASLSNKMALSNIGGPGGIPANNFSEADRKFVTTLVPGLAQRPEANQILLGVAERTNQLAMEKADKWAAARSNGMSYENFEREWRKDLGSRNVFGDLAEQAKSIGAPPPGGGDTGQPTVIDGYRIRRVK